MKIFKLAMVMVLLLTYQLVFAVDNQANNPVEVASDVIKVKAVRINNTLTQDAHTELFMDLQNTGLAPHTLIAAYSPFAKQTEIHEPVDHQQSSVLMGKINSIQILPHKDADLHFGGLHLMLIGLEQTLKDRESVPLILIFDDGSWISVDASVFTAPATP